MKDKGKGGSLRESMPITATWVDQLRVQIGREKADALLRSSMRGAKNGGAGWMYAVEIGPDGAVMHFGSTPYGRPTGLADALLACSGSSPAPAATGNSSRFHAVLQGTPKGVK